MSSAGENRQRFCESTGEEEDRDNAGVDEHDEDDEEVDMAIRDEIKRRAERLLNMHQKVEDGKNAQALWLTEARVHYSRNYFLFHFSHVNFVENHRNPLSFVETLSAPWIAFL